MEYARKTIITEESTKTFIKICKNSIHIFSLLIPMTCIAKWLLSSTNEFCLEFCVQVSLFLSLCFTFYLTFSQWIQLTLNTLLQFMILIFYLIGVLYFCLCTCNGIMEFAGCKVFETIINWLRFKQSNKIDRLIVSRLSLS